MPSALSSTLQVYAVRSCDDGKYYAVKKMAGYHSTSSPVFQEIKYHERLGYHPNIVHMVRAWGQDGRVYMQFELCVCK